MGHEFVYRVDHDTLKYMINKPQWSGRIARWILHLQEFNFTIEVRPSKSHVNDDVLSGLHKAFGSKTIASSFPYARLFYTDGIPKERA